MSIAYVEDVPSLGNEDTDSAELECVDDDCEIAGAIDVTAQDEVWVGITRMFAEYSVGPGLQLIMGQLVIPRAVSNRLLSD